MRTIYRMVTDLFDCDRVSPFLLGNLGIAGRYPLVPLAYPEADITGT